MKAHSRETTGNDPLPAPVRSPDKMTAKNPQGRGPGEANDGGESLLAGRSREHHPEVPEAIENPPQSSTDERRDEHAKKEPIDEAGLESFPASDPPSFSGAAGSPSMDRDD